MKSVQITKLFNHLTHFQVNYIAKLLLNTEAKYQNKKKN